MGEGGAVEGMRTFGASAPLVALVQKFGLTVESGVEKAQALLREVPA